MSVVIHEVSHGYTANALGDPTAKYAGRLTLNPIRHLDLFGSVILPVLTYMVGGFIFGWAKPVPYNPYNLKNQKWGPGLVGLAGPLSNIFVAVIFGLLVRFGASAGLAGSAFLELAVLIVFINLILAVFNLVPIPPLDGSKVLFAFLPYSWHHVEIFLERYGLLILLIFIFFFFRAILPIVFGLFRLITGVGL
jgi:Zn-dependent protease